MTIERDYSHFMDNQTIGAGEFKAKCLGLIDKVQETRRPLTITKRGKPVAQLVPLQEKPAKSGFGCMKGTFEITGDIVGPIDVEWNAMRGFLINEEQG
jgi:prevent-host-death family protein